MIVLILIYMTLVVVWYLLFFCGRCFVFFFFFFFQAEDGIRDWSVTGVQTCALPIFLLVKAREMPLRYGINPHQTPARAYVRSRSLPFEVLSGAPGYVNLLDEIGRASCRERV